MAKSNWDQAAAFHGHKCPGLAIGVRVCEAAIKHMNLSRSADEEITCISETDACGVDAIQALLGCTLGKGNLICRGRGKQAFTILNRTTDQAMRFCLKAQPSELPREAYQQYLLNASLDELFTATPVTAPDIDKAKRFASYSCEKCGEMTGENWLRLQAGQRVCLDCYDSYDRGWDRL